MFKEVVVLKACTCAEFEVIPINLQLAGSSLTTVFLSFVVFLFVFDLIVFRGGGEFDALFSTVTHKPTQIMSNDFSLPFSLITYPVLSY